MENCPTTEEVIEQVKAESRISSQKVEFKEEEKDKKRRVEYLVRHEAALPILDCPKNELENAVARFTSKKLEVLLQWKGISVSKMGNVANRRVLYQQFANGGE